MSVKRFVAASMSRALEMVREEMGPEAIILSSKRVKEGVEILTTLQAPPQSTGTRKQITQSLTDAEVPMGSDDAWNQEEILDRKSAAIGAAPSVIRAETKRYSLERDEPHSAGRGLASGKTPAELAEEIEQARDKMLAARRREQSAETAEPVRIEPRYEERAQMLSREASSREASSREESQANDRKQQEQQHQLEALQSELADMRLLLEEQLSRMAQTPQQGTALHTGLMRRLKHLGIVDEVASDVLRDISNCNTVQEAWSDTQATLSRRLPTADTDLVMQGGVFAFVGPTGAGKTTTIAKLAARYVLEHGPQNVALVTTDTYRIAAHDQLRSLGRILNVQVKVVDDNQDLPQVLRSLKGCPLVLVDTAGFRHGDSQLKEQLDILATIPEVKTLLVMSCNAQLQMLKASVHAHHNAHLHGCVLTKLDETASLGEALSVVIEHNLTVFYSTNGQEIPQDISVARGHRLVSAAVKLMKSGMGSLAAVSP